MKDTQKTLDQIDDATRRLIEDMLREGFGIGDVVDALVHADFPQDEALAMANAVESELYDVEDVELQTVYDALYDDELQSDMDEVRTLDVVAQRVQESYADRAKTLPVVLLPDDDVAFAFPIVAELFRGGFSTRTMTSTVAEALDIDEVAASDCVADCLRKLYDEADNDEALR